MFNPVVQAKQKSKWIALFFDHAIINSLGTLSYFFHGRVRTLHSYKLLNSDYQITS